MADETIQDKPTRPKGAVALADESPDELPALLAIAVGIAILAIAVVWPTIDPLNQDDGAVETAAAVVDDQPAEDAVEEVETSNLDLAAIVAGLAGMGFDGIDLSAADGVVTATGEVADEPARATAIDYIGAQPGVESVIDQLTIADTATEQGEATVTAAQASVVLSGTVPDEAAAQTIYDRALSVYSAEQIDNQLVVDPTRAIPTLVTIAGAMTDEVLFNQISAAFDDLEGVEVSTRSITLEQSTELETSLNALEPIQFASGSAIIDPASAAILDDGAEFLNANPDVVVEIGGHTDSRGSEESNQTLSQARAEAVKAALEDRGVSNDLIAVGFGERRLKVAPDDTAEAQQQNRRIEFRTLS